MAQSSDKDQNGRVSVEESHRYICRFLGWLTAVFAATAVIMLSYNLHSSSVVSEAKALLDGDPTDQELKAAYELLEAPHLFAGWRAPKHVLPEADRALDEEALAKVARELERPPEPNEERKSVKDCGKDLVCVLGAMGKQAAKKKGKRPRYSERFKVYRYLLLRRQMARGEAMDDALLAFFKVHLTLWHRAFQQEIIAASGKTTASDSAMLRVLLETREVATQNGMIFGAYSLLTVLIMGLILFLWWRFRRPEVSAEPAPESE